MKPQGIIINVDDDREDQELFRMALSKVCDCVLLPAHDGDEAYTLITEHKDNIFLIVSDLNMPRITGLELKRLIENSPILKLKAIPFIFHTSVVEPLVVKEAFALGIQGYMRKESDFDKTVANLSHFIRFWNSTVHPNVFRERSRI